MKEMGRVALRARLKAWYYFYKNSLEGILPVDTQACEQIYKLISDYDKGVVDEVSDSVYRIITYLESALGKEFISNKRYALRTFLEEELKQLLQSKPVQVDEDTILKIFDIYDEPETIPWKIATVKELLQSQRKVKRVLNKLELELIYEMSNRHGFRKLLEMVRNYMNIEVV